ncbi:hypothetical protein EC835_1204 [Providencia alcalifaciens]|uniref:Uncharacterized protein n=1 Tax=Providencia alcalifaciens TaxID=126385 RepID=A0A4R3NCE4_9GAMM|nr:hypothetical protein [Providencia alcalifaciens]TCT28138.1 hypothetical protein EC835_1204 [Providencia alcalifaciens]
MVLTYILKLWNNLNKYGRNYWVDIDNNIAKNAMSCIAVGTENLAVRKLMTGGD